MSDKDIYRSFSGKQHSGNAAIRSCNRIVLSIWRNGIVEGDGDEQQIVIHVSMVDAIIKALECGKEKLLLDDYL